MNIKDQIKQLQEQRIQEILNDTELTQFEKLDLIENENLFGKQSWIQHIFADWEEELQKLDVAEYEKQGISRSWSVTDDLIVLSDNYRRYEFVSYAQLIQLLLDDMYDNETETAIVAKTRGSNLTLEKPIQEVVDKIFNYAVEHKSSGFNYDW